MIYMLSIIRDLVRVSSFIPFFFNLFYLMLPFTCNCQEGFILFGCHFAYFSDFFFQDESIRWFTDLFVIASNERVESGAASID